MLMQCAMYQCKQTNLFIIFQSNMKLTNILKNISLKQKHKNLEQITHLPVLAKEIVQILSPKDGQYFIDMTFGGGGHCKYLLATNKKITIFTLDRDPEAFERAVLLSKKVSLQNSGQKVIPLLGRFSQLDGLLKNLHIPHNIFDGAIMDLGASTFQYESNQRGFSLKLDGPLDMRMEGNINPSMPTAADIINSLNAEDLTKIFKVYGEEKNARKIAQIIVDSRFMMKRLNTTRELAELVANITNNSNSFKDKLGRLTHPATKIFQALRIFVNNELNELNYSIPMIRKYLKLNEESLYADDQIANERNNGGLLAIISFHSLEDKIVKSHFTEQNFMTLPTCDEYSLTPGQNITKERRKWKFYQQKIIVPTEEELLQNPRSRSAKLRVGLRVH